MRQRRGKWIVVKSRHHPPDESWCCVLVGGNGEHPADGAFHRTWREAFVMADDAAHETVGTIEWWLR